MAASLLLYAGVVAYAGQHLLRRLTGSGVSPRLGVIVWQVAALSVLGSGVLGALALDGPVPLHDLSHLLSSRLVATGPRAEVPGIGWLQVVGVGAAAAVVLRAAWCVSADCFVAARRRRRHVRALELVARPLAGREALVVEHRAPMAYCVPGRSPRIVLTRGALDSLSDRQLSAVLAHERAHLRGRHHLALAPVRALARAFPGVPLLAAAAAEVSRLLEMCADDAAARRHGPGAVAGALRALSRGPAPTGALAATGTAVTERIARLEPGSATGQRRMSGVLSAAVLLLVTGPVAALAAPLLVAAASNSGYCPVPLPA